MERVTPRAPLTPVQYAVVQLLGIGLSHAEIATTLNTSIVTVRWHMRYAAKKIPGDLPREAKLVAWVRGATLDVLEGLTLRGEFLRDAQRGTLVVPPEVATTAQSA